MVAVTGEEEGTSASGAKLGLDSWLIVSYTLCPWLTINYGLTYAFPSHLQILFMAQLIPSPISSKQRTKHKDCVRNYIRLMI